MVMECVDAKVIGALFMEFFEGGFFSAICVCIEDIFESLCDVEEADAVILSDVFFFVIVIE